MTGSLSNAEIVLILSPHIDDGELGCGATINKLTNEKDTDIYYIAF